METLKNYVNAKPSGEIVGNVINWIIGVSNAMLCVYSMYIQLVNYFN